MRAKNDRGEKPTDVLRNEAILALLVSAAQELDRQEEEEEKEKEVSLRNERTGFSRHSSVLFFFFFSSLSYYTWGGLTGRVCLAILYKQVVGVLQALVLFLVIRCDTLRPRGRGIVFGALLLASSRVRHFLRCETRQTVEKKEEVSSSLARITP